MEKIKTPVWIDYGNGSNRFLIGADHELIFSTNDATQSEMDEIKSALNGKAAAGLFMQELLDSVETLGGIADEHGARTLADLMYLQNAILSGGFIDHYPGESKVLEIASALPSGEQWAKFIKVEYMLSSDGIRAIPALETTVQRMKGEIVSDVLSGKVSKDVKSFSELHDFVDANEYGGFCEEGLSQALIAHFGGRDANEGMPDGMMQYTNAAQNAVSKWLAEGGLAEHLGVSAQSTNWTNYYLCPCGEKWEDQHDCCCNDHCPKCDKEIEPYISDDGSVPQEKIDAALAEAMGNMNS